MINVLKNLAISTRNKIFYYSAHPEIQYVINEGKYKLFLQISSSLFSFFSLLILANLISEDMLGSYQLVLTIMILTSVFSFPGVKDAILQSVSRGYDYSLIIGTKEGIKRSLLGVLILLLTSLYFLAKNQNIISIALITCSIFFPFLNTLNNFIFFLEGKKEFKREFIYSALINFINFAAILMCVLFFKNNLIILITSTLLVQTLSQYYFFIKCTERIREKIIDFDLIKYGNFMNKINFLNLIVQKIDQLIIGAFLGVAILATYNIGITVPDKLKDMIKSIFSVFIPKFSKEETSPNIRRLGFLFLLGIITSSLLFVLMPIMIKYLFPKYTASIIYGQLYSLAFIVFYINPYLGYFFRGLKYEKALYNSFMISYVLYFLILLPLLYFYNIIGLLLARIIQNYVLSLIFIHYFNKKMNEKKE